MLPVSMGVVYPKKTNRPCSCSLGDDKRNEFTEELPITPHPAVSTTTDRAPARSVPPTTGKAVFHSQISCGGSRAERKKAACHHSNSQHSQSGAGLHSCFPGTMKPALGEPQQIISHRSLRSCEENRQTELVVVPRSVALGVVHRGDVHLAWAQLRIRNRHHRVAAFVDCGHQP